MTATRILGPSLLALFLAAAGCQSTGPRAPSAADTPYHPQVTPANFRNSTKIDNPYHPLIPGTVMKYVERDGDETSDDVITVTNDTKVLMGIKCVVVRDTVTKNGRVAEDTYDYFAQDDRGNVWYFGEATRETSASGKTSTKGSWEAGIKGALPGLIMPADPKPGQPYRQEYAPGEAEDMGQVVARGETVKVPAGAYDDCVKTREWSKIERGTENKWYAKGVGFVRSQSAGGEVAELVSVSPAGR
jgi:hypothetical protein